MELVFLDFWVSIKLLESSTLLLLEQNHKGVLNLLNLARGEVWVSTDKG